MIIISTRNGLTYNVKRSMESAIKFVSWLDNLGIAYHVEFW